MNTIKLNEKQLLEIMKDNKPAGKHTALYKGMIAFRKRKHISKV